MNELARRWSASEFDEWREWFAAKKKPDDPEEG